MFFCAPKKQKTAIEAVVEAVESLVVAVVAVVIAVVTVIVVGTTVKVPFILLSQIKVNKIFQNDISVQSKLITD
jgi:hypothetical protein